MNKITEKLFQALINKCSKDEIRLSYKQPEKPLSEYDSKIGGRPAVPAGFVYPEYEGVGYLDEEPKLRPLSFMAQINLKDVAELDTENLLPKTGLLSFFYDLDTMQWGFDPKDKGCARVYYFPENEKLEFTDIPENIESDFVVPELAVSFEKHISLPAELDFPDNDFGDDLEDYYDEYYEKVGCYDEWGNVTKLLGFPDVIQNPMEQECERVTRGYRCGNPKDFAKIPKSELPDIEEKSKEWILLFQMGTIETDDYELMFGDCGHIYFWIRKTDLENRNFDNVWLILQCS